MSKSPGIEKDARRKKKGARAAARKAREQARDSQITASAAQRFDLKGLVGSGASFLVSDAAAKKRTDRLRGEAQRLLRKRQRRDARELVPAVGAPPARKLPEQVFEVIRLLEAGRRPIITTAVAKVKRDGVETIETVPGKVVRFRQGRNKIEFHRKHYVIAKNFLKTRTELRLAEIQKKLGITRDQAVAYLRENGWQGGRAS